MLNQMLTTCLDFIFVETETCLKKSFELQESTFGHFRFKLQLNQITIAVILLINGTKTQVRGNVGWNQCEIQQETLVAIECQPYKGKNYNNFFEA